MKAGDKVENEAAKLLKFHANVNGVPKSVRLVPGENVLNEDGAAVLTALIDRKDPVLMGHLKDKNISLPSTTGSAKAESPTGGETKGVPGNAKDAAKLVSETSDVDLLERWAADESRTSVLDALDKRLTELSKAD